MTRGKLWFLSLAAAMGGFLFGYDTAVINGGEQQIQNLWNLSSTVHGWVMSAALWGTVLGALAGGTVTDRLGRKPTLFGVGVLYLVSAVWSAFAAGPYALMVARFVGGIGVGISSIAAPVYISEISPADVRGRMCALFQFNIVTGMVISQIVNWAFGTAGLGEATWRWMLGAEALPAFVFTALCPFLVESPRWLALRQTPQVAVDESPRAPEDRFFSRANRRPLSLAFCVSMFNQLSGIAVVLYFACRIFELAGCTHETALAVTAGLTALQGVGTLGGMSLIDKIGRRAMLILGGTGYVVSLFACAVSFLMGWNLLAAASIFVFVLSHAMGQGTVIWVFISEVFPQRHRAQGQSFGSLTHWVFCASLTFIFPLMVKAMPTWLVFSTFGAFMALHLLWAIYVVPETKGRALEEIRL